MIFTPPEKTIVSCKCKNKGLIKDSELFEIGGKFNGYPALICKKCSKLIVYKAPISYFTIAGFLWSVLILYTYIRGASINNALSNLIPSVVLIGIGLFKSKEVEIVSIREVPKELKKISTHFNG